MVLHKCSPFPTENIVYFYTGKRTCPVIGLSVSFCAAQREKSSSGWRPPEPPLPFLQAASPPFSVIITELRSKYHGPPVFRRFLSNTGRPAAFAAGPFPFPFMLFFRFLLSAG